MGDWANVSLSRWGVLSQNQEERKKDSLLRKDFASRGTQQDLDAPFTGFLLSCPETRQHWQEEKEERSQEVI